MCCRNCTIWDKHDFHKEKIQEQRRKVKEEEKKYDELFAGLTNYFNVMIMGRYSSKQELDVMESIGMTKKQKRKMFFWEGNWYFLLVELLVLTVGTGILWLVRLYMEKPFSVLIIGFR